MFTGIALSVAIFVAFVSSLSITKPLHKLVSATMEIAKGNFDIKVAPMVKTNDEIGSFTKSFDSIINGIAELDQMKNSMYIG